MERVTDKNDDIQLRALELKLQEKWDESLSKLFNTYGAIVYTTSDSHYAAFLLGYMFAKSEEMTNLAEINKSIETLDNS